MREEYEISKVHNNFLIPVGATGYMAKELWAELNNIGDINISPSPDDMLKLGNSNLSLDELHDEIMKIICNL